jgi:hypothetical protein
MELMELTAPAVITDRSKVKRYNVPYSQEGCSRFAPAVTFACALS